MVTDQVSNMAYELAAN